MKLIKKTAPIDNGDIITDKTNYNLLEIQYRTGGLGYMPVAVAGDSMAGYGFGSGAGAFFAQMRHLYYDADVIHDSRRYFNTFNYGTAQEYSEKLPDGQRGYNFATGSTDTRHLLEVQLPYILEEIGKGGFPPVLFVSCFQNDRYFNAGDAQITIGRAQSFFDQVIAAGITVIALGSHPQSRIGGGTLNGYGKHYVEQYFKEYAARKAGLYFVPILDLLKTGDPAQEAQSIINYSGPPTADGQQMVGVGRKSNDEIHLAHPGARTVGKPVADLGFRKVVREFARPLFDARDFSKANNPYGSFFGKQSRWLGAGGFIVDVADVNNQVRTATNNLPAGVELLYNSTHGITITPSLNPSTPLRPVSLTLSGTPNTDGLWALRQQTLGQNMQSEMYIWGEAWKVGTVNLGGLSVGDGRVGIREGTDIIVAFDGHGSAGKGYDFIHTSDPVSERVVFHSMPLYIGNVGGTVRMDLVGGYASGLTLSGRVDVGHIGMFKYGV